MKTNNVSQTGVYIGRLIFTFQVMLQSEGLTEADLDAFDEWLILQDTLMPIFDPTAWINTPREDWDEAKARSKVLRALLKLRSTLPASLVVAERGYDDDDEVQQ